MDSIFRVDGNNVTVGPFAAGPWNPTMQHGGAPSSLCVWAAERVPTATPMRVARLTIDLLRPVPVAPLTYRTEILREGRKIQLVAVHLEREGVEVARASVLKVKRAEEDLSSVALADALELPGPEQGRARRTPDPNRTSFGAIADLRAVKGEFGERGSAAVWFNFSRTFVEGHANSPAMCAAATSDFTNGVSSELDFRQWTYINADLTVSLSREPEGEWILLDGKTWIGNDGGGTAHARLADRRGYFGLAIQNLLVERR